MTTSNPIAAFRLQAQRYRLQGLQCNNCKALYFPKVYRCTCSSQSFDSYTFSGKGTLVSFTTVTTAPNNYVGTVPYNIGLVKLEDGPHGIFQLTDVEEKNVSIGMNVCAVVRKHFADGAQGIIHYAIKFAPDI